MLATEYDTIRFEKLNIVNMTASARGTTEKPGRNIAQKAGLNRAILAQGWGLLRDRTENKAPGRVQAVPAPYTSLRVDRQEIAQEPSRFRLFLLRLHLQRGPQRSN
jgi:putative transposase